MAALRVSFRELRIDASAPGADRKNNRSAPSTSTSSTTSMKE